MSVPIDASVVVTQIEERAFFSLWLLSTHPQQSTAHAQVQAAHDVSAVPEFSAKTLAGADIVYVSPALTELVLAESEIDALEAFVINGGRLIIPADSGEWADPFNELAARFEVTYGDTFINGIQQVTVDLPDNPIMNGPAGVVSNFSGASINDNLNSTNDDFQVVATWNIGPISIGYIQVGAGEVVFLSDFNTFDNDMFFDLDNAIVWGNLFVQTIVAGDLNGDGWVDAADLALLLGAWGDCEDPPEARGDCPADLNGDDTVNAADLALLLGNWQPEPPE